MQEVIVKVAQRPYQALIDVGLIEQAGKFLRAEFRRRDRVFVITVKPVRRLWGSTLMASLKASGFAADFIEMPDGESHKRLATVENLAIKMSQMGADRETVIVALGGGVVGDCAGLLAALYMRGVDLVQIPTTLLAQLDASIGGKTGVNLRTGKNLVGAFHHPRLVLIDLAAPATLPAREFRAGLYEALKCGVIGNAGLFDDVEQEDAAEMRRDPERVRNIVFKSVKLKAQIVSLDEREGGRRRVLNFGHTIGHALEAQSEYGRFLHGEAVAWGMIAATRISASMNRIDRSSASRIVSAVLGVGSLPRVTAASEDILRVVQSDKKKSAGAVPFVLPRRVGKVEIFDDVPDELILEAVNDLRRLSQGRRERPH